jgi:hypothetical protein
MSSTVYWGKQDYKEPQRTTEDFHKAGIYKNTIIFERNKTPQSKKLTYSW